jgi:hypothetical protein
VVLGKVASETKKKSLLIHYLPIFFFFNRVTLGRARELVDEFEIESSPGLARLLGDDPMGDNQHSERRKSSTHSSKSNIFFGWHMY